MFNDVVTVTTITVNHSNRAHIVGEVQHSKLSFYNCKNNNKRGKKQKNKSTNSWITLPKHTVRNRSTNNDNNSNKT